MYFSFDQEKIDRDYPILSQGDFDCLVHFVSLDMISRSPFDLALYAKYPHVRDKLFLNVGADKFSVGNVLPHLSSSLNIVQIVCCEYYKDNENYDFLDKGFEKMSLVFGQKKPFTDFKKLIIMKENLSFEMFNEFKNKYNLKNLILV